MSGFHLEGEGRGGSSPPDISAPPDILASPLETYVSSFFLFDQSEVKETLQKGRTLIHYISYRFHVFEWVTIVANSSSLSVLVSSLQCTLLGMA